MLTMFVTPSENSIKNKIDAILNQSNIPLFVSGNPDNLENIMNDKRIIYLSHPNEFIDKLKQIH